MKHIVKTLQRFIYILNSVNSKFIIENYIYIYMPLFCIICSNKMVIKYINLERDMYQHKV